MKNWKKYTGLGALVVTTTSAITVPIILVNNKKTSLRSTAPKQTVLFYRDATTLKEDDKWWTVPGIKYKIETVTEGKGKWFYKDMKKDDGKYKRLTLKEWYDTYDTTSKDMFNDPNHIYSSSAPKSYVSRATIYLPIYLNDEDAKRTRTGTNNNGLNGIYSGTKFWADAPNIKKYDISTIESYNSGPVTLPRKENVINGWEHVSPWTMEARVFGWTKKRKNVTGVKKLDWSTGDLHNIRPSIQNQFNAPRSNHPYGIVPGNNNKYPGIDFEIGNSAFHYKVVEPRISVRGDIARILLYMHDRYHVKYDFDYYRMLLLWAQMDPVTKEEKELDAKIAKVMGFSNGYVTGVKQLPYDAEVEKMVELANADKTPNKDTPGPASVVN